MKRWVVLCCTLLLCVLIGFGVDFVLKNIVAQVAGAKVQMHISDAINNAVYEQMSAGVTYEDLVTLRQDNEGNVTYIQANTVLMNQLSNKASTAAQNAVAELGDKGVEISLGQLFGSQILGSRGPKIHIPFEQIGSASGSFQSAFQSAGINQTQHIINLHIQMDVLVILPAHSPTVSVNLKVPLAETIIIGNVPDNFVDVNDKQQMLELLPKN